MKTEKPTRIKTGNISEAISYVDTRIVTPSIIKPASAGYRLFLDDKRMPWEVGNYIYPVELRREFRLYDWAIVRSYNEFVNHITKNGLPTHIAFDHDLADEHYTPEEYWDDYEKSKAYQDHKAKNYKEKTGKDCALWLCDYLIENNLQMPVYFVHSQNPVGRDNILAALKSFEKFEGRLKQQILKELIK